MKIEVHVAAIDQNDLVLLLLGTGTSTEQLRGRCEGITRLEKLAFLLQQETAFHDVAHADTQRLDFRPFHYGPYTPEIYDAVDFLAGIGLVQTHVRSTKSSLDQAEEFESLDAADLGATPATDPPYAEQIIELSDKGQYISDVLAERVGPDATALIAELKERFGAMPLRQLLRYVYARHPDMAEESRIKDSL